jgi:CspA family cold shock protein
MAMKTGTVKWFNTQKGYGFIKPVDGGFDVYVDIAALKRAGLVELKEGQKINFEAVVDERTSEVLAENLSFPTDASSDITTSFRRPLTGQKAGWFGGPFRRPWTAPLKL